MSILTVPYITGGPSHLFPLLVFNNRYLANLPDVNNYFLVPKIYHVLLKRRGIKVLDIVFSLSGEILDRLREYSLERDIVSNKLFDYFKIVKESVTNCMKID